MNELIEYLPYLIPYLAVSLTLSLVALVHILKHKRVRFVSVWIWCLIVLFFQVIGPIIYFLFGREEEL
ncbi:PLDc N-terminal domain-containing protein [Enterococcus sp. LJL128]|uniref:PLDc N-terminal domain-containing protein n=1 Tax=Enterococcus sp. LJL51 TaxID=3416656 RepID=UPI003CEFCAAD